MKVYLATADGDDGRQTLHAFTREEDATSYEMADGVESVELHDGPVEVRDWHRLRWWPSLPDRPLGLSPNPREDTYRRDYDGRPDFVEIRRERARPGLLEQGLKGVSYLVAEGWDLHLVRTAYSRLRAQYEADRANTPLPLLVRCDLLERDQDFIAALQAVLPEGAPVHNYACDVAARDQPEGAWEELAAGLGPRLGWEPDVVLVLTELQATWVFAARLGGRRRPPWQHGELLVLAVTRAPSGAASPAQP